MKKVLIVYDSKTGRTQRMAERIAEGVRAAGKEVRVRPVSEIQDARELEGYEGYLFGSPTYFKDTTNEMKVLLFRVRGVNLAGKVGGAFGSYTHIGSGAKMIYDTMEHVFGMNMAGINPFNVKEQILDAGKGDQACLDYGKAVAGKI
jgi:flavodoxin